MYAVLVPLVKTESGDALLLEVRSEKVRQPGEVCFPGGRSECGETVIDTAVRETCEELGLEPDNIEVISELDPLIMGDGREIHPVEARLNIDDIEDLTLSVDEVSEVFLLPLDWLKENPPMHYDLAETSDEDLPDKLLGYLSHYGSYREYGETDWLEYKGHGIWGLTARILTERFKMADIELRPLEADDREQFIKDNQEAFKYGAMEEFGMRDDHFEEDGEIISRATIEKSIDGGEAYRILQDGKPIGGVVIKVDGDHGDLDLLFVTPHAHSKGIGYAAWCAIEKLHPEVKVWETVTPYFETRNIHFYVNRCGFHIVEYFCSHHPDPNGSDDEGQGGEGDMDGMFRFEKVISG